MPETISDFHDMLTALRPYGWALKRYTGPGLFRARRREVTWGLDMINGLRPGSAEVYGRSATGERIYFAGTLEQVTEWVRKWETKAAEQTGQEAR